MLDDILKELVVRISMQQEDDGLKKMSKASLRAVM